MGTFFGQFQQRYNVGKIERRASTAVLAGASGLIALALASQPALADKRDDRIKLLETTVQELLKRDEQREKQMRKLQDELRRIRGTRLRTVPPSRKTGAPKGSPGKTGGRHAHGKAAPPKDPHGHGHGHDHGSADDVMEVWSARVGNGVLRLRRIGIDADLAFGFATGDQEQIETLFGGGHDPRQNGFTLRSVDLAIVGSFDPYFDARFNVVFFIDPEGETKIELEEAFLQTKSIAGFLKIRAGLFFTPFGEYNQLHVHDHDWLTQPVMITRLFGEDGLRGIGAAAIFDIPVPWRSTRLYIGMQNARGETQYSFLSSDEAFEERPIGGLEFTDREVNGFGALAYYIRLTNNFALSKNVGLSLGGSAVFGPNATGSGGRTTIFGFDATFTIRTDDWGVFVWRTEFAQRIYGVDRSQRDVVGGRSSITDFGLYTQLLWRINQAWGVGLRYEYASGSGPSGGEYDGRQEDPFRGDRHRLAPIAYWQFATFGRVTIQYTYDHADFLTGGKSAHALWLGLRWSFGLGAGHAHFDDGGAGHHDHDH